MTMVFWPGRLLPCGLITGRVNSVSQVGAESFGAPGSRSTMRNALAPVSSHLASDLCASAIRSLKVRKLLVPTVSGTVEWSGQTLRNLPDAEHGARVDAAPAA